MTEEQRYFGIQRVARMYYAKGVSFDNSLKDAGRLGHEALEQGIKDSLRFELETEMTSQQGEKFYEFPNLFFQWEMTA